MPATAQLVAFAVVCNRIASSDQLFAGVARDARHWPGDYWANTTGLVHQSVEVPNSEGTGQPCTTAPGKQHRHCIILNDKQRKVNWN